MNTIRIVAGVLIAIGFVLGTLMSINDERAFGHTLVLAAAIVFAGLLISLAVGQRRDR